jgi:hypothetical protein
VDPPLGHRIGELRGVGIEVEGFDPLEEVLDQRVVEHLGTGLRWIACAGLTLYYLVMAVGGVTGGAPRRWLFAWALPCAVVPVTVAWFGAELPSPALLAVLLATIVWMGVYGAVTTRRQRG